MCNIYNIEKEQAQIKKPNAEFRAFLDNLSIREHTMIIARIVEGCKVPRTKVYHWKNGRVSIDPLYRDRIEEITGAKIFSTDEE